MPNEDSSNGGPLSRRRFLGVAAVGGGAIIANGLIGSSAAAAGKMPQKAVNYQSTPKGKLRCDNCSLWQPPSACKLVQGPIAAAGWCILYKPKK